MLVVDDEPDLEVLIRLRFRKKIGAGEYDFVFARNGLEALDLLSKDKEINIILSDINMPEMDGLTLLSKLNELRNPELRTIIVSAYGDMDNIRTAMNHGAYDFVTKPIDFADLEKTIEKTIKDLVIVRNAIKEHNKLIAIQYDLDIANLIQNKLLPETDLLFQGFRIKGYYKSAKSIGGDYYDYFPISEEEIFFAIGDVTGKGAQASILMASVKSFLAAALNSNNSLDKIAFLLNNFFYQNSPPDKFVTLFLGIINVKSGKLTYINAGHELPVVIRSDRKLEELMSTGLLLGALNNIHYEASEVFLNSGDMLFAYTDGVTEAKGQNNKLFGGDRLKEVLSNVDNDYPGYFTIIPDEIKKFTENNDQSDDIAFILIKSEIQ